MTAAAEDDGRARERPAPLLGRADRADHAGAHGPAAAHRAGPPGRRARAPAADQRRPAPSPPAAAARRAVLSSAGSAPRAGTGRTAARWRTRCGAPRRGPARSRRPSAATRWAWRGTRAWASSGSAGSGTTACGAPARRRARSGAMSLTRPARTSCWVRTERARDSRARPAPARSRAQQRHQAAVPAGRVRLDVPVVPVVPDQHQTRAGHRGEHGGPRADGDPRPPGPQRGGTPASAPRARARGGAGPGWRGRPGRPRGPPRTPRRRRRRAGPRRRPGRRPGRPGRRRGRPTTGRRPAAAGRRPAGPAPPRCAAGTPRPRRRPPHRARGGQAPPPPGARRRPGRDGGPEVRPAAPAPASSAFSAAACRGGTAERRTSTRVPAVASATARARPATSSA